MNGVQALRISVRDGSLQSSVMFVNREASVTNEVMLDNEVAPKLSIFAVDKGAAYDIIPISDSIPLTLIKQQADTVTLEFHAFNGFNRDDYRLKDMVSGEIYPLDNAVTLPLFTSASAGRFILVKQNAVTAINGMENEAATVVFVEAADNEIVARSVGAAISNVRIYDISGTLITYKDGEGSHEVVVDTTSGVRIVSVTTDDGATSSYKLLVR